MGVAFADGSDHFTDLRKAQAQNLSNHGNQTFFFWCSDTVMATSLACFEDGSEKWCVGYDCSSKDKLQITGNIPEAATQILAGLEAKQQEDSGTDWIYDVTAGLGMQLVGFRHDTDVETSDPEPFQLLGETTKLRRAWWQVWK